MVELYPVSVELLGVPLNVKERFINVTVRQKSIAGIECMLIHLASVISHFLQHVTLSRGQRTEVFQFSDDEVITDQCIPSLYLSISTTCSMSRTILQDIVNDPRLLIDGMSKDDIKQGTLGDCWFLSSCAAVSREERFMKRVSIILMHHRLIDQS